MGKAIFSLLLTALPGTPANPSPAPVQSLPPVMVETTFPTETTEVLETTMETVAETTLETAEALAETITAAVQTTEETALHLADLFTSATGYMGLWLILGTALAAVILTIILCILLRKPKKKKKPADLASTMQIQETAIPGAQGQVPCRVQVGKIHGQGAREYQQDSFSVTPVECLDSYGILTVVADGMGGLQNGEVVSQTAVESMINGFLEAPIHGLEVTLWELLEACNEKVNRILGRENLKRSGSTMIAGILRENQFHWASIGDSRIYLWRSGILTQLNRDHVFLRELQLKAVNGQGSLREAYRHPKKGGLTSYLGRGELKYVDMPTEPLDILPGDVLLFMSDGVYNAMSKAELTGCLCGTAQEMADALEKVIEEKAHPHQDNYTAVVLQLEPAVEGGA